MTEPHPDSPDEASTQTLADDAPSTIVIEDLPGGLRGAIEAVLMVVDEPVTELSLASALQQPVEEIHEHLEALREAYADGAHGFTVRCVAGGWRFYSHQAYAPVIESFLLDGQQAKLSQAALETLAVIAYRQPISRGQVSAVRGVNVDGVVRTLLTRGLIAEAGTDQFDSSALGARESLAIRYVTTEFFLERMGLNSLDELPPIAPYLPDIDGLDEVAEGHL